MNPITLRDLAQNAPTPMARLAERAQNDCAPERQHHNTYYLWELAVRMLAAVAIARYRAQPKVSAAMHDALEKMARPSIGSFVEILRAYVGMGLDGAFSSFWSLPLSEDTKVGYAWICKHSGENVRKKGATIADLAAALCAYRNTNMGHGGMHLPEWYRKAAEQLWGVIGSFVLQAHASIPGRFLAVEEVTEGANGERLATVFDLTGHSKTRLSEPLREEQLPGVHKGYVYFETDGAAIGLFPWLIWEGEFIHVLNRASKSCVQYLNYYTGELLDKGLPHVAVLKNLLTTGAALPESIEEKRAPGSTWIGDYEIIKELGRGGMATVFLARQGSTGMPVALKVLPAELASDPTALGRFQREVETLKRVEHPSVISTLASGDDPATGRPYFAMELVTGCSMSELYAALSVRPSEQRNTLTSRDAIQAIQDILNKRRADSPILLPPSSRGSLPSVPDAPASVDVEKIENAERVADVARHDEQGLWNLLLLRFAEVADALAHLHSLGIIHRDIKPSNIMLAEDASRAIVMDLGIARLSHGTEYTRTGAFLGTLRYSSLEQVGGVIEVDYRTDLYSLGATMYELFTLSPLFVNESNPAEELTDLALLEKIRSADPLPACKREPRLPEEIGIILEKLLQKQRDHRHYASATALADDLRALAEQRPISAKPYTAEEKRRFELHASLRDHTVRWAKARQADSELLPEEIVDESAELGVAEHFRLSAIESQYWALSLAKSERTKDERTRKETELIREREENARQRKLVRRFAVTMLVLVLTGFSAFAALSWQRVSKERDLATLHEKNAIAAQKAAELAQAGAERKRAENDLIRGASAERHDLWDEASIHYASALIGPMEPTDSVVLRAREGLSREANLPVSTPLLWSYQAGSAARSVSFSRDGRLLAIATAEPHVLLVSADCNSVRRLELKHRRVLHVAMSPLDDLVAAVTDAGTIALFDTKRAELVRTLTAPPSLASARLVSVGFSPDGRMLAAGVSTGQVMLFEPLTGAVLGGTGASDADGAAVVSVAFSSDSRLVAAAAGTRLIIGQVNQLRTGKGRPWMSTRAGESYTRVAWVGEMLMSASEDNSIQSWRIEDLEHDKVKTSTFGTHPEDVLSLAVSPKGNYLLSGGEDSNVRVWSVESRVQMRVVSGFRDDVVDVAFAPDASRFALALSNGRVEVHAFETRGASEGAVVSPLRGHSNGVEMLAFASGKELVSTSDDGSIRLWDLTSGHAVQEYHLPEGESASAAMALASKRRSVFVGTNLGKVHQFDFEQRRESFASVLASSPIESVSVDPAGEHVVFGCRDGSLGLWTVGTPKAKLFRGHAEGIQSVALSHSGALVATGGADGRLTVWDAETLLPVFVTDAHGNEVYEVAWSPDDAMVASVGGDGAVKLWNVRGRAPERSLGSVNARVYSAAFSPDGIYLATASKDATIQLWDLRASPGNELVNTLHAHLSMVFTVRFSPDGALLASASEDRTIRLFSTQDWTELGNTRAPSTELTARLQSTGMALSETGPVRAPVTCRTK